MDRKRPDGREYYGADSPAIIQLCLQCTRNDCHNCLAYLKKKEKALRRKMEKEK